MTLRDALIADTERRGVRQRSWAKEANIRCLGERFYVYCGDDQIGEVKIGRQNILATDWEVCA